MSGSVNARAKIGFIGAWALAIGGMIGGGIYTLAGVIIGFAGPQAWISLILGCLIALATGRSYVGLSLEVMQEGTPISYLLRKGHARFAGVIAWWLLLVYILATAVYAFTFGQYVGHALGASRELVAGLIAALLLVFILINLLGIEQPIKVQIAAVCIELGVLSWLAVVGFLRWSPERLSAGVPAGGTVGVLSATAATFIAFEGFEMLAYDFRDLEDPRRVLTRALPLAVITVAIAYAVVTVGAASLVGAEKLVAEKEYALALAGERAAGSFGLALVTLTACASAASAINATLFSVSRLARTAAESRLLPPLFAKSNRRNCPHWSVALIGIASAGIAVIASLAALVQVASLAFLVLFALINGLAVFESQGKSWTAWLGTFSATGASLIVGRNLLIAYPRAFGAFGLAWLFSIAAYQWREEHRQKRGERSFRS